MQRWLLIVLGAIVVMGCLTIAGDYGLSWDEPVRWRGGDRKLDYYSTVLDFDTDSPAPKVRRDLYPGFFDMSLAILRRALPFSDWATSRGMNLCFGLLGILGCYLLAERLKKRSGGWAALFLLLYPGWFGHMFINPKDIPFAAMYVISLWSLLKVMQSIGSTNYWRSLIIFSLLAGLTTATRIPGLILFVYLALTLAAVHLIKSTGVGKQQKLWSMNSLCWYVSSLGIAAVIGFFALIPWWPWLHQNPFERAKAAVESVSNYKWEFPVLFFGEYIPAQQLPWSYLPTWILLTTPLILGSIFIIALVQLWRKTKESLGVKSDWKAEVPVVILAIALPLVYILIRNATLYNGLRHVLFLVPPVMALLAVSWALFLESLRQTSQLRVLALSVLVLGYAPVVVSMVRLHPYQYTYFNELAGGTANASRSFETEYWGTSYKEAAELLVAWLDQHEAQGDFIVNMEHPTWLLSTFIPTDRPYRIHVVGSNGLDAHFYIANTLWQSHTWWAGEVIARVERRDAVFCVVKSRLNLPPDEKIKFFGL